MRQSFSKHYSCCAWNSVVGEQQQRGLHCRFIVMTVTCVCMTYIYQPKQTNHHAALYLVHYPILVPHVFHACCAAANYDAK